MYKSFPLWADLSNSCISVSSYMQKEVNSSFHHVCIGALGLQHEQIENHVFGWCHLSHFSLHPPQLLYDIAWSELNGEWELEGYQIR